MSNENHIQSPELNVRRMTTADSHFENANFGESRIALNASTVVKRWCRATLTTQEAEVEAQAKPAPEEKKQQRPKKKSTKRQQALEIWKQEELQDCREIYLDAIEEQSVDENTVIAAICLLEYERLRSQALIELLENPQAQAVTVSYKPQEREKLAHSASATRAHKLLSKVVGTLTVTRSSILSAANPLNHVPL